MSQHTLVFLMPRGKGMAPDRRLEVATSKGQLKLFIVILLSGLMYSRNNAIIEASLNFILYYIRSLILNIYYIAPPQGHYLGAPPIPKEQLLDERKRHLSGPWGPNVVSKGAHGQFQSGGSNHSEDSILLSCCVGKGN